jgi:hypothetical protein
VQIELLRRSVEASFVYTQLGFLCVCVCVGGGGVWCVFGIQFGMANVIVLLY